jgi:large subunit ribosomal protein L9
MKVVLLEEVHGLGEPGTVKEVKNGYARNFLIPRKLAAPATPAALKQVQRLQAAHELRLAKLEAEAAAFAARIQGQELVFRVRAGEEGRLYGSVTSGDIAEMLARQLEEEVDRRRVVLESPIQRLGEYEVPVRLSGNHSPVVKVRVESETAEAQPASTAAPAEAPAPAAELSPVGDGATPEPAAPEAGAVENPGTQDTGAGDDVAFQVTRVAPQNTDSSS